jgi:hypothetical protein
MKYLIAYADSNPKDFDYAKREIIEDKLMKVFRDAGYPERIY